MNNQVTITLNKEISYSDNAGNILNFFSERLPEEVKVLFNKCNQSFKLKTNPSRIIINFDELIKNTL